MRRLAMGLVTGALLVAAAPASAYPRDPFVPLIRPATVSTGAAASGESAPGVDETEPVRPVEATARERLPVSGSAVEMWLALAYVLTSAGAAAIFLGRAHRPLP